MANLTVYRLTFHAGFHIGVRGVNLEESGAHIPSDSLFAAILDAFLRTGGDAEGFTTPFKDRKPPFLLTSAFPFAGGVRFFPMPVPLDRWFSPDTLRERSKGLKKVMFLSETLFRQMLNGGRMDEWLFPKEEEVEPTRGLALQGGVFWLTVDEVHKLPEPMRINPRTGQPIPPRALCRHRVFSSQQVPRVTLDRVSSASNIFHAGRVSFAPNCGLWFGVQWRQPDAKVSNGGPSFRDAFLMALAVLADDGLGGERTVGYGGFSWTEEPNSLALPDPKEGDLIWLLSRYHPREEELPKALTESIGYQLTPVAGWLRSWHGPSQRRKRIWLVAEGSLIRTVGSGPWGDIADVHPVYPESGTEFPHPVWRYGFALGAPVPQSASGQEA